MPKGDRIGMSLDDVIKKDWGPGKSSGRGRGGKGGKGIVRDGGVPAKARKGAKSQKGGGRGAKGDSAPKGRGKAGRKGRGAGEAGRKGRGAGERQASGGRGSDAVRQPQRKLRNLWRGARAPAARSKVQAIKAWVRGSPGSTKARGKGRAATPQRDLKKVNRAGGIQKRGRIMGSFFKGTARRKGGGKAAFGKSSGAQGIADANYGKGYSKSGSAKGSSKGKGSKRSGFKGGGSWDQDFDRYDRWADNSSHGKSGKGNSGGGGYVEEQKATDQLTAEDKRMMKKITIVAQLDKVPKPHPAMQGMTPGKNARRRSEGSLSSRFAANYRR